jgi:hypothetical protein
VDTSAKTYKGKLVISWGDKAPWEGKKLSLGDSKRLVTVEGKKCSFCQDKGDKHSISGTATPEIGKLWQSWLDQQCQSERELYGLLLGSSTITMVAPFAANASWTFHLLPIRLPF